jgi:hypothetical protein
MTGYFSVWRIQECLPGRAFRRIGVSVLVVITMATFTALPAQATTIPLGDASNYAILYTGLGGTQLAITSVTVNGNVGVGNNGTVQFTGPGTITGNVDFSAGNTGQFHNTNSSNIGPTSVAYNQANVTADLASLSFLNASLGAATNQTGLAIVPGGQTINENAGALDTINGITYRVFNVTSVNDTKGNLITIKGDGSGDPVIFNLTHPASFNGYVALNGLTADQVLWNFVGSNITTTVNTGGLAWQGIVLAPGGGMTIIDSVLDGHYYGGGDSRDMEIISSDAINTANVIPVPEPSTVLLLGFGFGGIGLIARKFSRNLK